MADAALGLPIGAGDASHKPTCHRCRELITNQFYKVGDYSFHRDHFNCCVCEKLLGESSEFRHKDGDFYCLAHYEERFSHVCPGCQLKIVSGSGKVIKALGFYYHQNCFVCTSCKTLLSGKFFSANGKPYCAEHSKSLVDDKKSVVPLTKPPRRVRPTGINTTAESQSPTIASTGSNDNCPVCLKVLGTDSVPMWRKSYHRACLDCKFCRKSVVGRGGERVFLIKEGQGQAVVCERDYKTVCTKWCGVCGESIVGEMVYINKGEYYHQDCFQCKQCKKHLDTYLCIAGELRCSDHTSASNADLTCNCCKKDIELNKIYLAVGRKFHKHCLKCNFCHVDLEPGLCKLREGVLSCGNCLLEAGLAQDRLANPLTPTSPASKLSISPKSQNRGAVSPRDKFRSRSMEPKSGRHHPNLIQRHSGGHKDKLLPSPGMQKKMNGPISEEDLKTSVTTVSFTFDEDAPHKADKPAGMVTDTDSDKDHHVSPVNSSTQSSSRPGSIAAKALVEEEDILVDEKGLLNPTADKRTPVTLPTNSIAIASKLGGTGHLGRSLNPRKITNWKKGEMIGRGQFGKVFVGLLETGQWIAVKQMDIKNEEDEEHVKNMEKEVQLMEKLRHENIVSLLGTQRDGAHFYILMEYVAGKSLDVLLKNFGPFPEVTIRWYSLQLVRALAFMHMHDIIHRDIKGKNILVDTNGSLKIADFGSAKQVANFSKDTPTLSYNYTPLWTAPEVVTSGCYDRKVDIWALGCVLIEMGTAKLPWHECKFENPFQILFHIGNSGSYPQLPSDLSETCRDFMRKCLTRDPDQRPDAADLLNHEFLSEKEMLSEELEFENVTIG